MFLSGSTDVLIVVSIVVIFIVFCIVGNIKKRKENKIKMDEWQRKRELEEKEKKEKIEYFNSIEGLEAYIEENLESIRHNRIVFQKIKSQKQITQDGSGIRFNRNPITNDSVAYSMREEFYDESIKYKSFTFNKSISFYQCLVKHLDEKGITEPELYNAAGIQRQTFYKIKSIEGYVPRRRTVFYFILYLKLTIEEANELLRLAGYQLNPSSKIESFIKHCIENELYDIDENNDFLYDHFNVVL